MELLRRCTCNKTMAFNLCVNKATMNTIRSTSSMTNGIYYSILSLSPWGPPWFNVKVESLVFYKSEHSMTMYKRYVLPDILILTDKIYIICCHCFVMLYISFGKIKYIGKNSNLLENLRFL